MIPAAVPPHKQGHELADAKRRLEMLELALSRRTSSLRASPLEIDRGGVSYTVDTLAEVHALHPQAMLFLLMGADSLRDLPTGAIPSGFAQSACPPSFAVADRRSPISAC